jgi:hypothetical protein
MCKGTQRFLHLARPFVVSIAKGPGRFEVSENASARDHIFSWVLQLQAKIKKACEKKGVRLLYVAQPFNFVWVASGLVFCQDFHAPLARAIFGLFPDPRDSAAIPRTGYVKIAS